MIYLQPPDFHSCVQPPDVTSTIQANVVDASNVAAQESWGASTVVAQESVNASTTAATRAVEGRGDRRSSGHPDVLSTTRLTFNHPCYLQPHDLPSATQATVERARHPPLATVVRASNAGLHRSSARDPRTDTIFGLVITL